jgi:hypothetical protein
MDPGAAAAEQEEGNLPLILPLPSPTSYFTLTF